MNSKRGEARQAVELALVAYESLLERCGKWLMEHGNHAPTCRKSYDRMKAGGNRTHPWWYGPVYKTDEEMRRTPCTCGYEELWNDLCQMSPRTARTEPMTEGRVET